MSAPLPEVTDFDPVDDDLAPMFAEQRDPDRQAELERALDEAEESE